jgi:integrase/recombinase XerC
MDRRIEEYLAYLGAVRGLSPRTLDSYRADFSLFESYMARAAGGGAPDLDGASALDVRGFAADLVTAGRAGSSVNRSLSALRGYYRYRVRFGALAADPTRDVEGLPHKRKLPRFMFEEEAEAFLALPEGDGFGPSRDRALMEFLYSTGCRVSEASGLTLDRLDLGDARGGSARVFGKGSKERVVFLAPPARAAIAAYLPLRAARLSSLGAALRADAAADEAAGGDGDGDEARPAQQARAKRRPEHLFVNARGGRLSERGIEWIIQGYADKSAERSGRPRSLSPHAFRHSFATHLVGRGADIRAVQELLGHASVSTTQVYAHVDMERLRKVYEQAHPHGGSHGPHGDHGKRN